MKAVISPILSNEKPIESNMAEKQPQTNSLNKADIIFAIMRRIESRLAAVELKASTLRRDVDRIGRKQYRDVDTPSIKEGEGQPGNIPHSLAGLFS